MNRILTYKYKKKVPFLNITQKDFFFLAFYLQILIILRLYPIFLYVV